MRTGLARLGSVLICWRANSQFCSSLLFFSQQQIEMKKKAIKKRKLLGSVHRVWNWFVTRLNLLEFALGLADFGFSFSFGFGFHQVVVVVGSREEERRGVDLVERSSSMKWKAHKHSFARIRAAELLSLIDFESIYRSIDRLVGWLLLIKVQIDFGISRNLRIQVSELDLLQLTSRFISLDSSHLISAHIGSDFYHAKLMSCCCLAEEER